jgi:hypothetical protein
MGASARVAGEGGGGGGEKKQRKPRKWLITRKGRSGFAASSRPKTTDHYIAQWNFEIWYFLDTSLTNIFVQTPKLNPVCVCVCVYVCVWWCVRARCRVNRFQWGRNNLIPTRSLPQNKKYIRIRKVVIFKFSWPFLFKPKSSLFFLWHSAVQVCLEILEKPATSIFTVRADVTKITSHYAHRISTSPVPCSPLARHQFPPTFLHNRHSFILITSVSTLTRPSHSDDDSTLCRNVRTFTTRCQNPA